MSSPFSKDYKAQIDLTDLTKERQASEVRTAQRKKLLKSEDAKVRDAALGNIGKLSKRKTSTFKG